MEQQEEERIDSAQKAGKSFSGRHQIFLHKKEQMGGEVISLCNQIDCVYTEVKSLSRVRLFANLWTVAHQAPPSLEFSSQEYWSGLPFPSPG